MSLVFSGIVPTQVPLEKSKPFLLAKSLGKYNRQGRTQEFVYEKGFFFISRSGRGPQLPLGPERKSIILLSFMNSNPFFSQFRENIYP